MFVYFFPLREEAIRCGFVSGNEHPLQILVLLPQRQLQQKDVRRVQAVCLGGRQGELQVRVMVLNSVLSVDLVWRIYPPLRIQMLNQAVSQPD